MAKQIKWARVNIRSETTFRTEKFGNLFSDTFQGEIYDNEDGKTWSGWCINLSGNGSEFRIDFASKLAATRWANKKLREKMK